MLTVGGVPAAEGATYTLNTITKYDTSDPDPITGYTINWGDGGSIETDPGDPGSFTHVYDNPGNYTITATAASTDGSVTATTAQILPENFGSITVGQPTFTNTPSGTDAGESYSVTATLTHPPGHGVTAWYVNWEDGTATETVEAGAPDSATTDSMTFTHDYAENFLSFENLYTPEITAVNDQLAFQAGPGIVEVPPGAAGAGTAGSDDASFSFEDFGPYGLGVGEPDSYYRDYTTDWGDGDVTTTTSLIPPWVVGGFTVGPVPYDYAGTYPVGVTANLFTDSTGATGAGTKFVGYAPEYVNDPVPTITAPDQTVASGQAATITFDYSGYCATGTGIAFIDWGDGTGPHPATVSGGANGTITATLASAPPPNDYTAHIYFYDTATADGAYMNNGFYAAATATFTLHTYGVDLTVGGVAGNDNQNPSGPAVPSVFIPLDDELSDNGITPENELAVPDSDDPELVASSVIISSGMSGSWSLQFSSTIRVYEVANSTMTLLTSGTDYPSTGLGTIALEIQGIATDGGSPIVALFTPTGATTSATSEVNEIVHSVINPNSICENIPGAELTGADKNAGMYLPVNMANATTNGTFLVGAFTVHPPNAQPLKFSIPKGFQVFRNANGTGQIQSNMPVTLNDGTMLYVAAVTLGKAALTAMQGNLQVFSVKNPMQLDTIHLISFVTGPQDVPQYGSYEYNAKFPKAPPQGAAWLQALGGSMTPNPNSKRPTPTDVFIAWGAGPAVGDAEFEASDNYLWDIPVNIVKVNVAGPQQGLPLDPGTLGVFQKKNAGNNPVFMLGNTATIVITSDSRDAQGANKLNTSNEGINWKADVTLVGPNGNHGVSAINVGFLQNLTVAQFEASWGATKRAAGYYETGVALENSANNQNTFLDTDVDSTNAFYQTESASLFNNATPKNSSKEIKAYDGPSFQIPTQTPIPGVPQVGLSNVAVTETFLTYVVAISTEAPVGPNPYYAAQASASWKFVATGPVNANNWGKNGSSIMVVGQNAWTALAGSPSGMKTTDPRFNTIILGKHKVNNAVIGNVVWVPTPR